MSTLAGLDQTLRSVEQHYRSLLYSKPNTPNGTVGITPSDHSRPINSFSTAVISGSPPSFVPASVTSIVPDPPPKPPSPENDSTPTQSDTYKRGSPAVFLATRLREDEQGGEVGLLPLRTEMGRDSGARERLLGPAGAVDGAGSTQLHEELGGQLSDVRLSLRCQYQALAGKG